MAFPKLLCDPLASVTMRTTQAKKWIKDLLRSSPLLGRFVLAMLRPFRVPYLRVACGCNLRHMTLRETWRIRRGPLSGLVFTELWPEEALPLIRGEIEEACTGWLSELDLGPGVLLDVGASYGYYTLMLSRMIGDRGRVCAFEPEPHSYSRLCRHLALNRVSNVKAYPLVVIDQDLAFARFHAEPQEPWLSRVLEEVQSDSSSVGEDFAASVSLDFFCEVTGISHDVRLLKIDVEGAEDRVLLGASKLLRASGPHVLCEVHSLDKHVAIQQILDDAGYEMKTILEDPGGRKHIVGWPRETHESC
jgi:FkbM family methyltransferase